MIQTVEHRGVAPAQLSAWQAYGLQYMLGATTTGRLRQYGEDKLNKLITDLQATHGKDALVIHVAPPKGEERSSTKNSHLATKSSISLAASSSSACHSSNGRPHSRRGIERFPEDAKEELRQVGRRGPVQQKWSRFAWNPASGGKGSRNCLLLSSVLSF